MDTSASVINPNLLVEIRRNVKQEKVNDALFNTSKVHQNLARWVYESGVPIDAINNDSFLRFVEAVGQFGSGYIPPDQCQLKEPLLKQEVETTKQSLKQQEKEWKKRGCSILIDVSSNGNRSIIDLCVNCNGRTCFLSSVEVSNEVLTAEYIFKYVDKCIEEVGPQNVVQVVADNASINIDAAKILKEKRPNIFWSSCATQTINLILEGVGELPKFKAVIDKAKALTQFIYAHRETLALMRKYTKKRDIVRQGVTKFASSYLTMELILEKREKLAWMFFSDEWDRSKLSTSTKAKKVYATIISRAFWANLAFCLEVFKPLVRVLRMVDRNCKPSMGFIYGELMDAKREIIKICNNVEATYKPILEIVDSKDKDQYHSPLHLAGYWLNPYYYYKDGQGEKEGECMSAVVTCIEAFFINELETQLLVCNELSTYREMKGMFSNKFAAIGRANNDETFDPVGWWSVYGEETPNLRMMAMKILSSTTSSYGCESCSTSEWIHTKKRNRLDADRLNNLVYIQFNAKLVNKKKMMNKKYDSLLANDASMVQEWIGEGCDSEEFFFHGLGITCDNVVEPAHPDELLEPVSSSRKRAREFDANDFESEDEGNFESDDDDDESNNEEF